MKPKIKIVWGEVTIAEISMWFAKTTVHVKIMISAESSSRFQLAAEKAAIKFM